MSYRERNLDARGTWCQEESSSCKGAGCPAGPNLGVTGSPPGSTRQPLAGDLDSVPPKPAAGVLGQGFVTMWGRCPGSSCCCRLREWVSIFLNLPETPPPLEALGMEAEREDNVSTG